MHAAVVETEIGGQPIGLWAQRRVHGTDELGPCPSQTEDSDLVQVTLEALTGPHKGRSTSAIGTWQHIPRRVADPQTVYIDRQHTGLVVEAARHMRPRVGR